MRSAVRFLFCLALTALPAEAQSPRSAIPWLSESIRTAPPPDLPEMTVGVRPGAVAPFPDGEIETSVLGEAGLNGIGTISSTSLGLPAAPWGDISALRARQIVADAHPGQTPAAQKLFRDLLLMAAEPPIGAGASNALLLARIDRLMEAGLLADAEALITRAGVTDPEMFRRAFDIGLLTGRIEDVCARLRRSPTLSPTLPARVYCLAQTGEWAAADLTLSLGRGVSGIGPVEEELLARFLDPPAYEDTEAPPHSDPLTTLEHVLRESVGLPRPAGALPLAFYHLDADPDMPPRTRIAALEKLVRAGAVDPAALFDALRAGKPAASGTVWDHAAAVQALDRAFAIGEADAIGTALEDADRLFIGLGLRPALSSIYRQQLLALPVGQLDNRDRRRLAHLLILAGEADAGLGAMPEQDDGFDAMVRALSDPSLAFPDCSGCDALRQAIALGLRGYAPPDEATAFLVQMIEKGEIAGVLYRVLDLLSGGPSGDPRNLASGLYLLRVAGFADRARQVALETLLLLEEA